MHPDHAVLLFRDAGQVGSIDESTYACSLKVTGDHCRRRYESFHLELLEYSLDVAKIANELDTAWVRVISVGAPAAAAAGAAFRWSNSCSKQTVATATLP